MNHIAELMHCHIHHHYTSFQPYTALSIAKLMQCLIHELGITVHNKDKGKL